MRDVLIIISGLFILGGVLFYSGVFEYIQQEMEPAPVVQQIAPEVIDTFRSTLEGEVQKQLGTPKEGYEPQMFLQVFPGLVESDFDGVEASIGRYALVDGRLVHEVDTTQLIHSAAKAISRRGFEQLYKNIADRTGVDVYSGGTLTVIMSVITGQ